MSKRSFPNNFPPQALGSPLSGAVWPWFLLPLTSLPGDQPSPMLGTLLRPPHLSTLLPTWPLRHLQCSPPFPSPLPLFCPLLSPCLSCLHPTPRPFRSFPFDQARWMVPVHSLATNSPESLSSQACKSTRPRPLPLIPRSSSLNSICRSPPT